MSEETPAIIVMDRDKLHAMLRQYTADQWDAAANHVEESHHRTKEDLVDSLRHVAQMVREKGQ